MHDWIAQAYRLLESGEPTVLVTVACAEGSTPREAGARLLVTAEGLWQTIGGGHLEWRATGIARQMLLRRDGPQAARLERLPLGPALGQCCGGAATLAFEPLGRGDLAWLRELDAQLRAGRACRREAYFAAPAATPEHAAPRVMVEAESADADPHDACELVRAQDGSARMAETLAPVDFHIVLCGAGHVAQALVRLLGTLPCTVHWIDERDTLFPAQVPANVEIEASDTPEAAIAEAPAGSYFLVMTHSHALDQHLCQHIFRRDDYAYFGLIGSRTKHRQFERRLRERGVTAERYASMTCPIGVEGVTGKVPEVIAVAVAAQLLQVRERCEQEKIAARDHALALALHA
ncbi:xanthine dehydrogenase accessory protein XdhC [Candidimonas humi]|uniref:Xanthine dehydrogenase accessory protein XdhC n=1 Tax=Candidimonas humi TaxID=683355 RepID=A0ABV8NZ72_9BURK|nr:xanthine dehydrogenase accessory protein XdhC [Candidimonas humi]MBV6304312.1 xanthine dehydrogenase accessory protein XdhC [Candidimonas humi]